MAGLLVFRSPTARLTAILIATPLCLSGCSAAPALSDAHASLRTAAGSDVLAAPSAEHYSAERRATGSLREQTGEVIASSAIDTSGRLTLTDGVITDAEISATAAGVPTLRFTLTEPIVLRRDGQSGEPVDAVGTLVVGTMERRDTTIRIQPEFEGDSAHVTATITLPESLMHAVPDSSRVLEVSVGLRAEN